jgi:hypothetical protein
MSPNPAGWSWWRTVLLLFLLLSVPSAGLAKTKGSTRGSNSDIANIIRPDLVNAETDPTLRFPVMSMPGSVFSITYGWLDITSSTIRYTVVQPASKAEHAFEVSKFSIGDLRFNRTVLSFKSPQKRQMLIYLPQDRWGSVHTGPGMSSASSRERLGTSSIYKTLLNFDGVLALVKPPAPPPAPVIAQPVAPAPPPKPAAPPSPPAIVLSSPPGAGENQTVEWGESTVVIRGVAMDSTGIPVVKIKGSPANMRPQTTQAAEFWSDPLPLQAGSNHIQIVASNSAHVESILDLTVDYKPKVAPVNPRALDRTEIIGLLQGGVQPSRVADLIKERGIKFSLSADDVDAIRAAGGTDDLIEAIQQAAPHP